MNDQPTSYSDEYIEALKILTPREVEVLDYVAANYSSKQIAEKLDRNLHTVERHREEISRKLEIRGYDCLHNWCRQNIAGAK